MILRCLLMAGVLSAQTAREWNDRGLAHEDRQEWMQAESAFRKGLKEARSNTETLTIASNLAFLYLRQDRAREARRMAPVLETAIAEAVPGPDLARALGCVGSIYWRTGDPGEGIGFLRRSVRMWTDAGLPLEALAVKNNLAAALYDAGHAAEADALLEELTSAEGLEHPSVLANAAILKADRGRFAEAAKGLEAALACPYHDRLDAWQRAEIRSRYAAVLRKLGRRDEAKRREREASALWREANAFTRNRVDWRDLPAGGRRR